MKKYKLNINCYCYLVKMLLPIIWHCSVTASPSVTVTDVRWLAITGGESFRLSFLDTSKAVIIIKNTT